MEVNIGTATYINIGTATYVIIGTATYIKQYILTA